MEKCALARQPRFSDSQHFHRVAFALLNGILVLTMVATVE
jgi:hypothetical protein